MPNSRVVFDIETLAFPMESFDAVQQEYLMKFAKTDEEKVEAVERFSLGPLTSRVITIAMLNPDTGKGQVFYEAPAGERWSSDNALVEFVPLQGEKEILEHFWAAVSRFKLFITFNGRSFDCPFLLIRSAIHGVKATRNLMPPRFKADEHYDLMEQLTFYGATRKYNLDFYCKAFGIHSPKTDGITGKDLGKLFDEKRFADIARYCMADVTATAELYRRWVGTVDS